MPKSYLVTGMVIFIDGGSTYYTLCKECYDKKIDYIREKYGLTNDEPIFLSTEYDYPPECDECGEEIDCEVIG